MTDDTILPFSFPAVSRKKVTAAFDGGRLTSDGGVILLAMADRGLGVAEKLSCVFPERRDPGRIVHSVADMIRARVFAIACGYEDGNDLDHLRGDPAFKLACGRLPDTGRDLCSQPTVSRLENAPHLREVIRLSYALVDIWMDSYERAPSAVTLDIDDTVDVVHGRQQLSLFNAHYDEHCFLPIHVYDTERSRPVAVILRPGKTPSGIEVRAHLRRLVRHIRRRWPTTRITFRGDSHYGLPRGDGILRAEWYRLHLRAGRHEAARQKSRCGLRCRSNRTCARQQGRDARLYRDPPRGRLLASRAPRRRPHRGDRTRARYPYVVTSLNIGSAEWTYDSLYCARGQAENLIKLHKTQLASDRTSCRSALANQVRLVFHTAAYWLVLTVRDAIPKPRDLATAEFNTIRLRLLKIAARVIETATRVRLAFAAACPDADLFRGLANALIPQAP